PNTIFSAISTRPPSSMASGSCWLEQLDPIPHGSRLPVDHSRHGRDEELARVDRRARRYQKLDDRDVMDTDHWAVNLPHWRTGRQWFRSKDAHGYSLGTGSDQITVWVFPQRSGLTPIATALVDRLVAENPHFR